MNGSGSGGVWAHRIPTRLAQVVGLSMTALLFAACGGGEASAPKPVAAVDVSPTTINVQPGQSSTLTATPRDADGNIIAGRQVTWTSGNTAVATVSSAGAVTGVSDGTTSISASVGGVSGSASVTVRSTVATVAVTPSTGTVTVGRAPLQLTAEPRNANGAALAGRAVTWSSSAPTIATVSATGLVSAVAPGPVISAASEGITGTRTSRSHPIPATWYGP